MITKLLLEMVGPLIRIRAQTAHFVHTDSEARLVQIALYRTTMTGSMHRGPHRGMVSAPLYHYKVTRG